MTIMAKKVIKAEHYRQQGALADKVKGGFESTRSVQVVPATGAVLNKKLLVAQGQADALLTEVRAEADRIRAEAQGILAEVEQVRDAARAAGYQEGREEGLAAATEYAVKLQEWKTTFFQQAEPDIIRLVLMIAEKVIGKMVHEHKEAIHAIVRLAIESALGDRIVVRLNPEDYRVIQAKDFEYRDLLDRTKRLSFKEDEAITKGGCVVETEVGTIDAQLETQLQAIRKALQL